MKKYYIEMVKYENGKDIAESWDIGFYDNEEEAKKEFNEQVRLNDDYNYGIILSLVNITKDEYGNVVDLETLDILKEE